jgi:phage shock protein PspC (stress-responsive transcriptional regulator)
MTARSQQDDRRAARLMLVGSCLVLVAGAATALYLIATGYMTNDWRAFYAAGELMRTHPRQSMVLLVPAAALYLTASQSSAHPIVDIKYVLFGLVVVTLLWALTYAGLALMILPIMATYTALSLRWPEPAAEAAMAPQQVELALAS